MALGPDYLRKQTYPARTGSSGRCHEQTSSVRLIIWPLQRATDDSVTLIGKLGTAPEIKLTANGRMLTLNLGVQVISWTTDEGGQHLSTEKTSWHRVVSFRPRLIRRAQHLEKDDTVVVRGYLDQLTYEKDGQELFITEFVAEELDPIRAKRLKSAVPRLLPVARCNAKNADMLRITIELLPGGRESGAMIVSRGPLPISNLAGLAKAIGGVGD